MSGGLEDFTMCYDGNLHRHGVMEKRGNDGRKQTFHSWLQLLHISWRMAMNGCISFILQKSFNSC
jgi:hypothetical protein